MSISDRSLERAWKVEAHGFVFLWAAKRLEDNRRRSDTDCIGSKSRNRGQTPTPCGCLASKMTKKNDSFTGISLSALSAFHSKRVRSNNPTTEYTAFISGGTTKGHGQLYRTPPSPDTDVRVTIDTLDNDGKGEQGLWRFCRGRLRLRYHCARKVSRGHFHFQ
jgi:hypothetical protein